MPFLSEEQLQEIEIRADAATPGLEVERRDDGTHHLWVGVGEQRRDVAEQVHYPEDAHFLRDGPADVRALVDEVRTLRRLLRRALPHLREHAEAGAGHSPELHTLVAEAEELG